METFLISVDWRTCLNMRLLLATFVDAFSPEFGVNNMILQKSSDLARMLLHPGYEQLTARSFIFLGIIMLKIRIAVLVAGALIGTQVAIAADQQGTTPDKVVDQYTLSGLASLEPVTPRMVDGQDVVSTFVSPESIDLVQQFERGLAVDLLRVLYP